MRYNDGIHKQEFTMTKYTIKWDGAEMFETTSYEAHLVLVKGVERAAKEEGGTVTVEMSWAGE